MEFCHSYLFVTFPAYFELPLRNIIRSTSFVCFHLAGSNAVDVKIIIHLFTDGKIACQLCTDSRFIYDLRFLVVRCFN